MKSDDDTQMRVLHSSEGTPILSLWVDYRLPSLNVVFKKTHWWRISEKKKAQSALASALQLRAAVAALPTWTTSCRSS